MQTTISYNIPDEEVDSVLAMLGYTEWSKEEFMNKAISDVIIPAISDVFTTIKQNQLSQMMAHIPSDVRSNVESMISITTR